MTLKILGTVRAPDQWSAAGELRKRLLAAFTEHGIEIPRPQRVILSRDLSRDPGAFPTRRRRRRGRVTGADADTTLEHRRLSRLVASPAVERPAQRPAAVGTPRAAREPRDREPAARAADVPAGSGVHRPGERPGDACTSRRRPDFEAFWAKLARERISWFKPFDTTLEWDLPFARWFDGGQLNVSYNCVDRHVENGLGSKVAYHWIGEPGDTRDHHLRGPPPRGPEGRQRAARAGHRQGRSGRDLHADDPRAADRDARLRPDRRAAHGRLRRLLGRGARGPDQRRRGEARHHRGRRLAARQARRAQAGRRRGGPDRRPRSRACSSSSASATRRRTRRWSRAATSGGTTSSTPSRPTARRVPLDSEHMLYLLYTSGSTAKPKGIFHTQRRLPAGHQLQPRDDLRHQAGRRVLVRGGHRLGDRATATSCTARWPTPRPASCTRARRTRPTWDRWWQIIEDYKVTRPVLRPDRDPGVHEAGRPAPAKHDLSSLRVLGCVGEPINPEAWLWYHEHIGGGKAPIVDTWWQTETGQILITPLPGRDDDQARQRHVPVPRASRRTSWTREGNSVPLGRRRLPRPEAALAGDAPRHLRRPGAVQGDVLEPLPGHVLRRRRRQARRGRLLLAARPRGRRHERLRPSPVDDRDRKRARVAPRGRRGRRGGRAGSGDRRGDQRVRDPAPGQRADGRARQGAARPRRPQDQPDRQARSR